MDKLLQLYNSHSENISYKLNELSNKEKSSKQIHSCRCTVRYLNTKVLGYEKCIISLSFGIEMTHDNDTCITIIV